jgi:hypothetical protein
MSVDMVNHHVNCSETHTSGKRMCPVSLDEMEFQEHQVKESLSFFGSLKEAP